MAISTETQQIAGLTLGATLADRIGNTPLLRLERLVAHLPGITLLGKAEWANPGGSVKDRAASGIVGAALKRGLLSLNGNGRHLLDATSGNQVFTVPFSGDVSKCAATANPTDVNAPTLAVAPGADKSTMTVSEAGGTAYGFHLQVTC